MMDYATIYQKIHEEKPKHWAGTTIRRHVDKIAALVLETHAKSLLDYGCGKGFQYLRDRVHDQWGGLLPHCFDVGVRQLSARPERRFDGVISTDMLEHVEEQDVEAIIADIVGFADRDRWRHSGLNAFVFLSISCKPCKDIVLPDGRNGHICLKPPEWWRERINKHRAGGLIIETAFDV